MEFLYCIKKILMVYLLQSRKLYNIKKGSRTNMKKFLCNFFVILYFIVAIMITVCLLSYNKYNITEIGNYSLVLSTDEELKDVANKGDLILVEKVKAKNLNVGDKVFFYSIEENETVISAAKIISKEENGWGGTSITVEGNYKLSAENIVSVVKKLLNK